MVKLGNAKVRDRNELGRAKKVPELFFSDAKTE